MSKIKRIISFRLWLHGLVGAAINSGANAVTLMIVKPEDFNLKAGLNDLIKVTVLSAIFGAALYLKRSPLPPIDVDGDGVEGSIEQP